MRTLFPSRLVVAAMAAAFAVVVLPAPPALAIGLVAVDSGETLSSPEVTFSVEVSGEVASSVLEMAFASGSEALSTAELRFPLPPGAVLHRAEVWLPAQGRWETARTLGRREGREIYDEVVPEKVSDPLLVQQIGTDAYRALVYPVSAKETVRLRIHYAHLLEPADGGARWLRIALGNDDVTAPAADSLAVDVRLASGEWREGRWTGPSDGQTTTAFDPQRALAEVRASGLRLDRDLVLELAPFRPLPAASGLVYLPTAATVSPHLLVRWAPDVASIPGTVAGPRNVVFVIDVSGSMQGRKLEEAKQAVSRALRDLGEGDRFGIVSFSDDASALGGGMLGVAEVDQGLDYVAGLEVLGGTNVNAGLQLGVQIGAAGPDRAFDLLLVTDGNPTVGPTGAGEIGAGLQQAADAADRQVRLYALGIGYDLDQSLINALVTGTGGEASFALEDGSIAGQFLDLFGRVRSGGLIGAQLTLAAEGLTSEAVAVPRLFDGNVVALGGQGAAVEQVALSLQATTPDGDTARLSANAASLPAGPDGVHRVVPALAAKVRADALERQADRQGETTQLLDQAVVLAKTYGIVTRYTSLLALDDPATYAEHGIETIERDAAGVALAPVAGAQTDEGRIGGAGLDQGDGDAGYSDDTAFDDTTFDDTEFVDEAGATGCSAVSGAPSGTGAVGLGLLLGLLILLRRRRST